VEVLEDRRLLSFVPAGTYMTGGDYPYGLGVGDVNADANPDLVVASYRYIEPSPEEGGGGTISYRGVLQGNGSGGFSWLWWDDYTGPNPGGAGAIDFNRDGITDRLITQLGVRDTWDPRLYVGSSFSIQLGDGAGGFGAPRMIWVGRTTWAVPVAAGDFNRDGYTDLAVAWSANGYGYVDVLLNDAVWPPLPPPIPAVHIDDMAVTEGHTGTRAATFTVSLSIPSGQPVTVDYATASGTATGGTDYQSVSGTLTFAPGETTKTVSVPVNGDRLGEPDETLIVNLSHPTNSYVADGQAVGTILDDEPHISITDVAKAEGKKGRTTLFVFTVTLSAAYDQPVTMSFATTDGSARAYSGDYVAKSGTLTFAPGETTKTITIEVKGDGKREYDEYFYVDLSGNSSNSLFTKSYGVGEILNDD
jgi:hypothetical protein